MVYLRCIRTTLLHSHPARGGSDKTLRKSLYGFMLLSSKSWSSSFVFFCARDPTRQTRGLIPSLSAQGVHSRLKQRSTPVINIVAESNCIITWVWSCDCSSGYELKPSPLSNARTACMTGFPFPILMMSPLSTLCLSWMSSSLLNCQK
jgi:hypothetical protein